MDKCLCNNLSDATQYILPCSHILCEKCLYDSDELVCPQCFANFKKDNVSSIPNNDTQSSIELCNIHNEQYTKICEHDHMYCDKCECSCITYDIKEWKRQILTKMENFRSTLLNKISRLNCIIEIIIIINKIEYNSIIKQIEDIIDTIFVNISHIDNFNQFIDNIPISSIIKRKNKILNTSIVIPTVHNIRLNRLNE
jgi:hypothetical protein